MKIIIGTRKSKLAMIQTELVKNRIIACFPGIEIEILPISTKGDEILDRSLASFGGKGVFTKELEDALLNGKIDMAVHSAKDMPMDFPEGLTVGAVLERANPADVSVTMTGTPIKALAPGSVVGTSSLRRELQTKKINPCVQIKVLRGNVQTRLDKLENGDYDAIILAAAGLERLGLLQQPNYYFEYLDAQGFMPAAGQGILAIESRVGEFTEVLRAIHSREAEAMLVAERTFLAALGGGCNAPCGALSRIEETGIFMKAIYVEESGEIKKAQSFCEFAENKTLAAMELGETLAGKIRCKKVALVGAGPGDKGLISVKGLECVRSAEVLVYDNLVSTSIVNEAPFDAELIYAGKRAANHYLRQEEINKLLIEKALEGKKVVRLKGGDPFVFGRGGEEAQAMAVMGIPFEIVPGVSAATAVPAYAGIPITHREMASSFHVITGHEGTHKKDAVLDYKTLAREEGTLVFLMGLHNLPNITALLMANGKDKTTPAAVIEQGTGARQRTVTATLAGIAEKVTECGIQTPAVTVIGKVALLHQELKWLGNAPLYGKKVLLTGTPDMVGKLDSVLSKEGAETVSFSLIHTKTINSEQLKKALCGDDKYRWIVFSSSNGVEHFFKYIKSEQIDLRTFGCVKFAVIGAGTAKTLEEKGFTADFVPSNYTSEDFAAEWIPGLPKTDHVLLLRASTASEVLNRELTKAGIAFLDIPLYETVYDYRKKEELNRIIDDIDYITLASASAVRAFAEMIGKSKRLAGKVICIGPVTAKQAAAAGLPVTMSAAEYTAEGIRDAILYDSISTEK